jgi:hypothetical protein
MGGGLSFFIKNHINYKVRHDLTYQDGATETLWIEIDRNSANTTNNLLMGLIYRIPGTDPKEFMNTLNNTLLITNGENKQCIHCGDYNLNLLNTDTHLPTKEFIDMNFTYSLYPTINRPTRITSTMATIIDNLFTSLTSSTNSKSGIILSDLSDHFPIFLLLYNDVEPVKEKIITYRSNTIENKNDFTKRLENVDWSKVTNLEDTQKAYTTFHEEVTKCYTQSFPLKTLKQGYSTKLMWLTPGLRKSISIKHKLHVTYLKHPTPDNISKYKLYKNRLNKIMKKAERQHYQDELSKCQNNMRKSWAVIKEIINKNRQKSKKIQKLLSIDQIQ